MTESIDFRKENNTFVFYKEWEEIFGCLPDSEKGALIKAIFAYVARGETLTTKNAALKMAFTVISAQLDRDGEKWAAKVKARREAGKKGGRPPKTSAEQGADEKAKKPNGFSENQSETKKPDNVDEDVNVDVDVYVDEREGSAPAPKNRSGLYQNVKLTTEQIEKLDKKFGIKITCTYITRLDEYIQITGKNYKDHEAIIRRWIREDAERAGIDINKITTSEQEEAFLLAGKERQKKGFCSPTEAQSKHGNEISSFNAQKVKQLMEESHNKK